METRPGISLRARPFFCDALTWNEDGQIAISVDTSVHILAPVLTGESSEEGACLHVGITRVDPEGKEHDFGECAVLEKPVQSSFSLAESYRCAVWSPSGLSNTPGSFLTVITTKHRVLLYSNPDQNDMKQDWQPFLDLTYMIKEQVVGPDGGFENLDQINQFHSLYCAWSQRIIADPLAEQPAILSVSNKAGEVSFWSYTQGNIRHMKTTQPHQSFVNLLRWTGWQVQDDKHISYFFSTCADGTVCMSSITIRVHIDEHRRASITSLDYKLLETWFTEDHAIPTSINVWDDLQNSQTIKVILCKGITVQTAVIQAGEGAPVVSDWRSFTLENSGMGLSGACWSRDGKVVKTYTHEGECVVLFVDETETTKDDALSTAVNLKLSGKYHQQWMEEKAKTSEDEDLASSMMPIVWGATDSMHGIYTAFLFSLKPLVNVHFRTELSDDTWVAFLLQSERVNTDTLQRLCQTIDQYVHDPDFLFTYSVKGILSELLEFLADADESTLLVTWLSTLEKVMSSNKEQEVKPTTLTRRVYSDPSATAARVLVYIDMALKNIELPSNDEETMKTLYTKARQYITEHYLRTVLAFILDQPDAEFKKYHDDDIVVMLLLCDQALLQPNPPKPLITYAKSLLERIQKVFSKSKAYKDLTQDIETATALLEERETPVREATRRERCPACDDLISPSDATMIGCPQGHFWDKCSMTMRVMPIPNVRKCSTCGAKSLQPGSLEEPGSGEKERPSLTDDILSQCWKCVVCGSDLLDIKVV